MNLVKRNTINAVTTSFYEIPLLEKDLEEPQPIRQASPPVTHCFYSKTRKFQCQRCLAVHSITFALRAYTFKTQRDGLMFVFAFTSLYGHTSIQNACELKYCTDLNSLSSRGCHNLNRWFPQVDQALNEVGAAAKAAKYQMKMSKNDHIQRRISTEADIYFSDVISRHDVKIRSKIDPVKIPEPLYDSQEIMDIERFLDQSKISCLSVQTSQLKRYGFLHCLVR